MHTISLRPIKQFGTQLSFYAARSILGFTSHAAPTLGSTLTRWAMCYTTGKRKLHAEVRRTPNFDRLNLIWRKQTLQGYGWRLDSGRPRILLVHGWAGHSLQYSNLIEPLLQSGFEVFAFDLPAHGRSSGHFSTLPEMIQALSHIIEVFGPVHGVIGHSMGANAIHHVLQQQMTHTRMVAIAPLLDPQQLINGMAKKLWVSKSARTRLLRHFEQQYQFEFPALRMDAATQERPTLIIHDEQDRTIHIQHSEVLHQKWRAADFLRTRGHGHVRVLRAQETCDRAIQFLCKPYSTIETSGCAVNAI